MPEQKTDFIGKRVNDVKTIFGLAERDWLLLLLLASVGLNIYQAQDKSKLQQEWKDEIVRELRRSDIPNEVEKRMRPIEEGWDQARSKIDTLVERVKK